MSEARTQANRKLEIATPLGDDVLMLTAMHGSEALGRMFEFELDLISENSAVDFKKILGQNVTIRLDMLKDTTRYFNGYISRFALTAMDERKDGTKVYSYRATMVPWLWFLTRYADCRIFQNKAVLDIIKQVFKERGFTDIDDQHTGTYRTWEYCVQYRETDFNFVSRLMENEGLYYYFKHENGKHTLVICDATSAHKPATNYDSLQFDVPDNNAKTDAYIWNWTLSHEITPNQYALTDYDPLQPQTALEKSAPVSHSHDPTTYEIFDYPGGYVKPEEGKEYVTARMNEIQAQYGTAHATSSARGIFAGCTFSLTDHPTDNASYLITSASYQLTGDDMGAFSGKGGGQDLFMCQVSCITSETEFRSPRATPKPVVQGPQTAVVVGAQGEEIHCDKYGRVKVHFFWDRKGTSDENASCYIRVSQPWAGKKWGAISIPRVGQEVIVEFLEGDPDRPIITGRVYNGSNMPPYDLPDNQTMTTFKTNSSKGGGGFNEFRFEDKKGSEQIYMWAQKDMQVNVQNDRYETIKRDHHTTVDRDSYEHVKDKKNVHVEADNFEQYDADNHITITGKEAKQVGGSMSLQVAADVAEVFSKNHSETTSLQYYLKANEIILEADQSITIKVSGTSIAMDSSGITITTSGDAQINAGGKIAETAGSNMSLTAGAQYSVSAGAAVSISASGKASITAAALMQVQASGPLVLQGAVVKIN